MIFELESGHPRFFLGSDSAPHPPHTKATSTPLHACAAGVYTSPILLPLVAHLLESFGALNRLPGFVSGHGRAFYKRAAGEGEKAIKLQKIPEGKMVEERYILGDESLVPYWAGKPLNWEIVQ